MTAAVVLAGALVIGATLGLLGGGGTVLAVPLVRALLGLDTRHAIALGATLLFAAAFLWNRRGVVPLAARDVSPRARRWLFVTGGGAGVLTGIVGGGGGFLIVPALVVFGRYTTLDAVPISLFAIAFSAATAAVGYGAVPVAWGTALVMAAAASSGVVAGGALARRLNPAHLRTLFAAVLLGASGCIFLTR